MRYRELILSQLDKTEQFGITIRNSLETKTITAEKVVELMNKLLFHLRDAIDKVVLENER